MNIWHFTLIPEIDLQWDYALEREPWLDEPQPNRREMEIEQEFQASDEARWDNWEP